MPILHRNVRFVFFLRKPRVHFGQVEVMLDFIPELHYSPAPLLFANRYDKVKLPNDVPYLFRGSFQSVFECYRPILQIFRSTFAILIDVFHLWTIKLNLGVNILKNLLF